jgi:hypothetical protein
VVSSQVTTAPAGCVTYNAAADTSTISPSCYSTNAKVYLANVFDGNAANSSGNRVFSFSSLANTRQDIVRLDEDVSEKVHLFARAIQDETPENFPTGLFAGANYPGIVNTSLNAPGENVVANLTYTITPSIVNEAEFAYSQGTIKAASTGAGNSPAVLSQLTNTTAYTDPYGRIPNIGFFGGTITGLTQGSTPYDERNLDRTLFDNLSLTKGQHTVRVGFTISQLLKTENASEGDSSFTFADWQSFLLGQVATYSQASRDITPDLRYLNMEAYAQDDWKISTDAEPGRALEPLPLADGRREYVEQLCSGDLPGWPGTDARQQRKLCCGPGQYSSDVREWPDFSAGIGVQCCASSVAGGNVLAVWLAGESRLKPELCPARGLCAGRFRQWQDVAARRIRHIL